MKSTMMVGTGMMGTSMMPGGMMGTGMLGSGLMGQTMPGMQSGMMVPRCTVKMEKCQGGMKIACICDDPMACSMVQNLCTMLQGGMCSCCMTMNGMMVCCCNVMMGLCKCDMT